jgi:hypothetical protein
VSVSLKDRTATHPSVGRGPDFKKERDNYLGDFNLDQELLVADSKQDAFPVTKRINIAATPTGEPNRANSHLYLLQPIPHSVTHMAMNNA